jgi:oligoribonuclease (3'-5' exoribonuclease)
MTNSTYYDVPRWGLALDWETSGYRAPSKGQTYADFHQGLSFGAKVVDMRSLEVVEELYLEIQYDPKYTWDQGAAKVHGLTKERLANGVTQQDAAITLANLIMKYFGTEDVILIGHRVYFDRDFTNQLFDSIDIKVNWHPTLIDVSAVSTIMLEMSRSEAIFQALGMPPRKDHNAMEDISMSLEVLRILKRYLVNGMLQELNS